MSSAAPTEEDLARMSLLDHLDELRKRLFRMVIAFAVAFIGCWVFHRQIFEFLAQPVYRVLREQGEDARLVMTGVQDGFILYIKVAALAGIFVASPVILYQLWSFIAPGLYKRERMLAGPFVFFGSLLFISGGAFAYYIAFPFAVDFLLEFSEQFRPVITGARYLGFLMTVILGMGVMFELPTLVFLLSKIGVVTPRFLLRHFRWAVLIIFIIAAVITPTPDVVNLFIFAMPTLLLYLLGIGVAALFAKPRSAETSEEDPQALANLDDK